MDITVTEIMELADMHAYAKITDGTPAEQRPRNLLERRMQQIVSHVFGLECQLTGARLEIASLQARVNECGAGAGCCAQAARIAELEAQLEAVGAGGVGALVLAEAALSDIGDADREPGDDLAWCEKRAAKDLPTIRAALKSMQGKHAAPQPAAQALDSVRVFWQQHTQADALSMAMAELHDDVELVIRAARGATQAAPVDAERWLDLLAEARAALWQPANAALCERLDAFIDAARAAPAQAVPAPGEPSEAPTQAQVDERSDTVWLFIRLGQKNIRRAITLLEIDSMRAPELAFGPLLLKAIAELRKT